MKSNRMNLAYQAYKYLSTAVALPLFPPFWLYCRMSDKRGKGLLQRLGIYDKSLISGNSGFPRIWMHAVSVGEIGAAIPIIDALIDLAPGCSIVLSTTTESGYALASDKLRNKARCIYAPVDLFIAARRAFKTLKPHILVCLETELWPNWIVEAKRMGIKTALINGRISVRSIAGYLKIRPLMQSVLQYVDAFSMISDSDARRIQEIGAPKARIEIHGNAKYDHLLSRSDPDVVVRMKRLYNVREAQPVFVAGSTRGPEEAIVLDVYEKIVKSRPDALLIIAPRHVNRARRIQQRIARRSLSCQVRSELGASERTAPIVILDTIGELQATYSIGSVIFCGGSLAPFGGQNILEAAVWGKPVLYGPSMEDFLDAKQLLDQTGGGITILNGNELAQKTLYYINNPREAARVGRHAMKAVMAHQDAAVKHAGVVRRLLSADQPPPSFVSQ